MYWKVVIFIWPFLKEMFLGDQSVREAVENNKIRVLAIGIICLSIALNFFTVPKVVAISKSYMELAKQKEQLEKKLKEKEICIVRPPPASAPVVVAPRPDYSSTYSVPRRPASNAAHGSRTDEEEERLRAVRERFLQLKRMEEAGE